MSAFAGLGDLASAAALGWHHLTGRMLNAGRVDLVRPSCIGTQPHRLVVLKLRGAAATGSDVAAVLCSTRRASFERTIYERYLPRVAPSSPVYYGSVPHGDGTTTWQFMEFVDLERFSPESDEHVALLADWLGALHAAARGEQWATHLPERGWRFHADQVSAAKRNLHLGFSSEGYLAGTVRNQFEFAQARFETLTAKFGAQEGHLEALPHSFVHGDLKYKNVGFSEAQHQLVVIDWEYSGWGPIAVDLGPTGIHHSAHETYAATLRREWPDLESADIEHMGRVGEFLRGLMAFRWVTDGIPLKPAAKVAQGLLAVVSELSVVHEDLGW